MTPEHIAMLIAAPIIVLIILWAPVLDFIGPLCVRFRKSEPSPSKTAIFEMRTSSRENGVIGSPSYHLTDRTCR